MACSISGMRVDREFVRVGESDSSHLESLCGPVRLRLEEQLAYTDSELTTMIAGRHPNHAQARGCLASR